MNWNYIAGFFDGEGNIVAKLRKQQTKKKAYHVVRIAFTQNNKQVLDQIKTFLEKKGIKHIQFYLRKFSEKYENQSDNWYMYLGGYVNCKIFLEKIRDKVIVKREECLKALAFLKEFKNYRFRDSLPKKEIETLRRKGMSYEEIGEKYQCSDTTIMRVLGYGK
jgi:intein/homing endonuclease